MTVRTFLRFNRQLILGLAMLGMVFAARTDAATLQYQLTGTATGSLDSVPFTSQTITLTMLADPANVINDTTNYPWAVYILSSQFTIDIAGMPQASINSATYALFSVDFGAGFGGGTIGFGEMTNLDAILGNQNNDNPTYNLGSPATVTGAGYATYSTTFPTDIGDLVIDSTSGNAVLTVTNVPEPSTVITGLASAATLAAIARRKRKQTLAIA